MREPASSGIGYSKGPTKCGLSMQAGGLHASASLLYRASLMAGGLFMALTQIGGQAERRAACRTAALGFVGFLFFFCLYISIVGLPCVHSLGVLGNKSTCCLVLLGRRTLTAGALLWSAWCFCCPALPLGATSVLRGCTLVLTNELATDMYGACCIDGTSGMTFAKLVFGTAISDVISSAGVQCTGFPLKRFYFALPFLVYCSS